MGKKAPNKNNEQMFGRRDNPLKIEKALINPIPKGKEESGNLDKLRPIALLEAPKKLFTKILNNRMVRILTKNQVLSELNWAGLPGGCTRNPINILNKCIEIAKEEKKELWITFQDMRKAFDSISKIGMEKALERIRSPSKLTKIVKSMMRGRLNKVILSFSLSEAYEVMDGIDQGDAISPLLWRIFYDPLIKEIQESTDIGQNIIRKEEVVIPALVYMDDTT